MGSKVVWGAATAAAALVAALASAIDGASVPHAPVQTPLTRPLTTAVLPLEQRDVDLRRVRQAGARMVRVAVGWAEIAPQGQRRPAGFDAANPNAPAYDWQALDRKIKAAAKQGLQPILSVHRAPAWAQADGDRPNGGDRRPDVSDLGLFARAAALRYSGRVAGIPRVRYWQVWNEPNLTHFLNPQFEGGRLVSPAWYRAMVNATANAVKSVHRDNFVIAGGTAPFECHGKPRGCGSSPFGFMRSFLCLSRALKPVCRTRARFDAWAHHPYTTGGPTRQARRRDDASLGDLPEMKRVLDSAFRQRLVQAGRAPQLWVTEFSWDTKPPDRGGVPAALHARWVAEALYRMWSAGVSVVTWWTIRDEPYPQSPFQSGLYYRGPSVQQDRAKPALQAFRFPFVAFADRGRTLVWGRTPTSRAAAVTIEQKAGSSWRRVAVLRANRYGIFRDRLAVRPTGSIRARAGRGAASTAEPFSLKRPREIRVQPFGDFPVDVDR